MAMEMATVTGETLQESHAGTQEWMKAAVNTPAVSMLEARNFQSRNSVKHVRREKHVKSERHDRRNALPE